MGGRLGSWEHDGVRGMNFPTEGGRAGVSHVAKAVPRRPRTRMRRKRYRGDTKVWRDPLLAAAGKRISAGAAQDDEEDDKPRRKVQVKRTGARIIAGPKRDADPNELDRERLLGRVLVAEGRPSITKACDAYVDAGFDFPPEQKVWLQILEHRDEGRVVEAIERLGHLLDENPPERRAVLESRLRRIEEYADEPRTQRAASDLRRLIKDKYAAV